MVETFFASCPRGLEPLLSEDLTTAGARIGEPIPGGVHFAGDWTVCYRANLHSRIATRILWRVAHAPYRSEEDIFRLALAAPWPQWFTAEQTIRVDVNAIKCPLKSVDFVALRIKDAICDRFRRDTDRRPNVDTRQPDIRLHAFLGEDECTLYVDTSGAPLYQRGYRQKSVDAPLKENLAAGILRLTGWQPGVALLDPMCGSGTFVLEAAQIALGIAPGSGRSFAFQRLRPFAPQVWQELLDAARLEQRAADEAAIFAGDISPVAVRATLANLDRAGLLPAVTLTVSNLLERAAPAAQGIMIANPPYGERVHTSEEPAEFYARLGSALKQRFAGWTCFFISADTRLPRLVRLNPSRKTPLFNGPLECRLYEFRMVAGSNRRPPTGAAQPETG
ncbi:MAG: THUMP domain-containing protein [Candidatus Accumulibacter sp.]|uniref:THUMP domain-containing class I SAM-dependent RNA methyltransferase n=1 Tax=Accumulibacter sp. TaxID=2053492 RepID=UPI002879804E|nr:THUMP domain-containing protein [Accumulibacter sp.]MDS4012765.1 THUMP domain-containing protein [Accumulibacter sp.]